jgi:hypothetical protein
MHSSKHKLIVLTPSHTNHDCPSTQCILFLEYIGWWSQIRNGRLSPARTAAKVKCKLIIYFVLNSVPHFALQYKQIWIDQLSHMMEHSNCEHYTLLPRPSDRLVFKN